MMVGALGATVTVNVQGAAGKLDAWIDFNGDGSWGGPGEQIFASQDVVTGDNNLTFDVHQLCHRGNNLRAVPREHGGRPGSQRRGGGR